MIGYKGGYDYGRARIKTLENLIEKNPDEPDLYYELAERYMSIGDKLKAISVLVESSRRFPNRAGPWIKLAELHLKSKDEKNAYYAAKKATEVEPDNPAAWVNYAYILRKMGSYITAAEACGTALGLSPDDPKVKIAMLKCSVSLGNFPVTERLLEELGDIRKLPKPDRYYAHFAASLLYVRKMLYPRAAAELALIPPSFEHYPEVLNNLALVYTSMGNFNSADAKFKELLMGSDRRYDYIRNIPEVWINYGLMLEKAGRYEDAYRAYTKAEELRKGSWPYAETMKKLYIDGVSISEIAAEHIASARMAEKEGKAGAYGLYLGCVIPNRYPMIESATRLFLHEMGIKIYELEGASCCPAPGVFRSFDIPTWLTIAARNITLAENNNVDLVTMCNGCYGTLLEAAHQLNSDESKKEWVNKHLSKIGKKYTGKSRVKHLIEVIYFDIGLENIIPKIKKKLNMEVAVHYGCHIIKPPETKPWNGEFEDPRFFDEIVEITGCKSIDYKDKMMCCGAGGGVRSSYKEASLDFTFTKLRNMRDAGAQAIITCCPFCHLQFDLGQIEVNRIFADKIDEPFSIPVIYITQLLDYCMGKDVYIAGLMRPPSPSGTPPFVDTSKIFHTYMYKL